MKLLRDFKYDLDVMINELDGGKPFAFARFCDGEEAILVDDPVRTADGWSVPGAKSEFTKDLRKSLVYCGDRYYIGISCDCCMRDSHGWYLDQVKVPENRLTFCNLFVDGNYDQFCKAVDERSLLRKCAIVGSSSKCDYYVPPNAVNSPWDIEGLIADLRKETRPILVAAGPAACIIIHNYWRSSRRRTSIVDVGSALDQYLHGRVTRGFQGRNSPNRRKICQWSTKIA